MSGKSLHPAIAELLERRRLGSLEESRHRFTVSREDALVQLRAQVKAREDSRWAWTLALVRAANAVSEQAAAQISTSEVTGEGNVELRVTTIDVVTPNFEFDGFELGDLLAGALEPDLGAPLQTDGLGSEGVRKQQFSMLIGRALNAALALDPVALELSTAAGSRRFERREQLVEGRDPYVERKLPGCEGNSRFVVRLTEPRPGISSRLGAWLRGRSELANEIISLWQSRRVLERAAPQEDGAISLGPVLARPPVMLGRHARLGVSLGLDDAAPPLRAGLWLARDGVLLLDLGVALHLPQLGSVNLCGWVECPSLRLTADERSVAQDANAELLLAWLHEYMVRVDGEGQVHWPSTVEQADEPGGNGRLTSERLAEDAQRGRELVYVWRHQARGVDQGRIAALWPSQEALIRASFPALRVVPLRALGQHNIDPADLTALAAGSHEVLSLAKDAPCELPELGQLQVSIDAYVHRARNAVGGFMVLLAYERKVAQISDAALVFAGVTLVARISPSEGAELDVAALGQDRDAVTKLATFVHDRTADHHEALLAHVLSRSNPWENPLLRAALDTLGPGTIELRYQTTELGVRLGWRDSVLLGVTVGRTRDGQAKTLRDGLRTVRERGFILLGHPLKRYEQIRSSDPLLQPWLMDDDARALLGRLVGAASLLEMPVVAEAHPLVIHDPVEDQRHLVRGRDTIKQWLDAGVNDRLARQRLLGHLLVARGLGLDTLGLETVPLLDRYDPRALSPTRLVSLAAVLAEDPRPGMIPTGAVHRGLPRPMLEVTAGVAALLAEVEDLQPGARAGHVPASVVEPASERSVSTPIRRRARGALPLLAKPVVHPLLVGRIHVNADASSDGVALWLNGLKVDTLEFPEPLGRVSGRLLLTPAGRREGPKAREQVVRNEARALLADALRQRTLLPPDGPRRRRLELFIDYMRGKVREQDTFELAEALGLGEPTDPGKRVAILRAMSLHAAPLRALGARRDALLAEIVRQSLAMAVHFDTAMLSWRAAKLSRRRDGAFELEFGLRNPWIQRGLDEDRLLKPSEHREAAQLAALFVVASFFEQAREREDVDVGPEHLVVALWRLLKLGAMP